MKGIIKEDVYKALSNGCKKGNISYNGAALLSELGALQYGYEYYVPLRIIAETLGYEVGWNKDNGAVIAGGFIKENSNKYWKSGMEPIEIAAPTVVNGVTYVPINYFTDVLGENVSFDYLDNNNLTIKIFSKDEGENNFDRLVKGFSFPSSGEEAAKMYAEAVKERNGAIQYALLSDVMRAERYGDFSSFAFVTGVSSPWVGSYEISKIDDKHFDILFAYKTSVPTDFFENSVKITVGEKDEYRVITAIE